MIHRKKGISKLFANIMVIAMIITLTAGLLITNAGAIAPGMTASNEKAVNNSNLPDISTLKPGQVAAGKNVEVSGAEKGQFTITYSAIGRELESFYQGSTPQQAASLQIKKSSALITPAGVKFTDTFEAEYAFVDADDSGMKIFIDGSEETALKDLGTGKYVYRDGDVADPANLLEVTIDPANHTVVYIIGANRLHLVPDWFYSEGGSEETYPNTLSFDVRLLDTVNNSGTFRTNIYNSCKVEFNALQSNTYYYETYNDEMFSNVEREEVVVWGAGYFVDPWSIDDFSAIRLSLVEPFSFDDYYQFELTDGHIGIIYTPGTVSDEHDYWYDLWIEPGIYTNLHPSEPYKSDIVEILPPSYYFSVQFDIDVQQSYNIDNSHIINVLTPLPVPVFIVNDSPDMEGDDCSVTISGTAFSGKCLERLSATNWSFRSEQGYLITLLNEYDLKVVYREGGWKNTTEGSKVEQYLDSYGTITLSVPDDPPTPPVTSNLTVTKSVTGVNPSDAEQFAVKVVFTPGDSGIKASNGAVNKNGTFDFLLAAKDGIITFSSIPVGTKYTVTETISVTQSDEGWSADLIKTKDTTGEVTANGAAAVLVNDKAGVQGTSDISPEPSAEVKGESDILPQTGGISSSTLLGIFGLALISIGGTAFVIFRKKFLS
jgi:LPXTG-motif cell wall-anchored protein